MRTLLAKRGWRAREPSGKATKAHSTARTPWCQGDGGHSLTKLHKCNERLAVQCRAMRSRFRVGVVLVTLTVHLFAPVAAYASATPPPGFSALCSANRNATALSGSTPALPLPYSPKHASSHCAFCSGSASAAILPSALSLPVLLAHAEASLPHATRPLVTAAAVLLPPSRGPPGVS